MVVVLAVILGQYWSQCWWCYPQLGYDGDLVNVNSIALIVLSCFDCSVFVFPGVL